MRRTAAVLSALTLTLGAATAVAGTANAGSDTDPYTASNGHAGPMAGIVPVRGDVGQGHGHGPGGGGGGGPSPDLTYHGGPVRHTTDVTAIFWGTSWSNAKFVGDKITGLDQLYGGLSSKNAYADTNGEYTDSSGAVDPGVNYQGHMIDPSKAVSHAPQTSDILNEVVNAIGLDNLKEGAYYPVYVDTPRGHTGYCAWHTAGTVNGLTFQFGFFFNLDGDPGCDPQAPSGHSQGLSALANVTGHEYSEMTTDPDINAWYDSSGAENSDKCAWTFGAGLLSIGGSSWKIQGNWSNLAYDGNAGYTFNGSKVRGCIDGTNT